MADSQGALSGVSGVGRGDRGGESGAPAGPLRGVWPGARSARPRPSVRAPGRRETQKRPRGPLHALVRVRRAVSLVRRCRGIVPVAGARGPWVRGGHQMRSLDFD